MLVWDLRYSAKQLETKVREEVEGSRWNTCPLSSEVTSYFRIYSSPRSSVCVFDSEQIFTNLLGQGLNAEFRYMQWHPTPQLKKTSWPIFMDMVQLSQGYRANTRI